MQRLFSLEAAGQDIALDLQEVMLVHRDAVKFLACCEVEKIKLENCPGYIREWIDAERRPKQPAKALINRSKGGLQWVSTVF